MNMNLLKLKGILFIGELNLIDYYMKEMFMLFKNVLMFYKCDLFLVVRLNYMRRGCRIVKNL